MDFERKGYTIKRVCTLDQCSQTVKSIEHDMQRILFPEEDPVVIKEYFPQLLVDHKLRTQILKNPKILWENGNTLKPFWMKSTGQVAISSNPEVQKNANFNSKVIETIKECYSTLKIFDIGYTRGSDRIGYKVRGCPAMDQHIDTNPLNPEVNFRNRVQSLVTFSVPQGNKNGSLVLIPYFHHYFEVAAWFFQLKWPRNDRRFYVLPKESTGWLSEFNLFLDCARNGSYKEGDIPDSIMSAIKASPEVELKWEAPQLQPGDMICWHQYIPHYNDKHLAGTPKQPQVSRVVAYISLFDKNEFKPIGGENIYKYSHYAGKKLTFNHLEHERLSKQELEQRYKPYEHGVDKKLFEELTS